MIELPMVKCSDPNPDCLLVKRGESHAGHELSGPGGNKPGSHCGGIASDTRAAETNESGT